MIENFPFEDIKPFGIVNTYTLTFPQQGERYGKLQLTYVLARGGDKDVAVYAGSGEPQWIVNNGVKLPYEEAVLRFPNLQRRWYRA